MINQQELKTLLDYESNTGDFYWNISRGRVSQGEEAGNINPRGYRVIRINQKNYLAHRLAWLLTHDRWPIGEIDHINGLTSDNRIENLREVSRRENCSNYEAHRKGKLPGVSFHIRDRKWIARARKNGRLIHLGYHLTEKLAHESYKKYLENNP